MASFLSRLKSGSRDVQLTIDDYAAMLGQFTYRGYAPPLQQTLGGQTTERPSDTFKGLAQEAYGSNGIVFACMLVRQLVFSGIRFQYQQFLNGKPSNTFGLPDLALLEQPWPGGTTQDFLTRLIQDADLAGNSYWVKQDQELVRLRPDWVQIVGTPRTMGAADSGRGSGQVGWVKRGYIYTEGGFHPGNSNEPVVFTVNEVIHYAPNPDPLGVFTGMSWLTPILREVQVDRAMSRHQRRFFDNGATPNMVVKHALGASTEAIGKFSEMMKDKFAGADNAYKTLHLYPGADATVVGSDFKQVDFANLRDGGETRIAAAAGVPPVIAGLSKGLDSATYSNYGQARRRFGDGTMHPLWKNAAGSIQNVVTPPSSASRLWYDTSDVSFLREDEADAANIAQVRASTINTYVASGFTPESAVAAVDSDDVNLLKHSGLVSVQLLPPGTSTKSAPTDQPKRVASSRDVLQIELIPREDLAIEAPAAEIEEDTSDHTTT